MIIIFFIGVAIMASGTQVSNIYHLPYISLICNVVGSAVMCVSAVLFSKAENKKRNELKLLAEKLVGKEEYENGISKIIDSIDNLNKTVNEDGKYVAIKLDTILSEMKKINENVVQVGEHSIMIKEVCNQLHSDNDAIREFLDGFMTTNIGISKNIEVEVNKLIKESVDIKDSINNVYSKIDTINMMPEMIFESVDTLIERFGETLLKIQTEFKYLEEDILEQEKDRTKQFQSIMEEICDFAEENNEKMVNEIKELAGQYEQFEKTVLSIVEQMSQIAEEDIKVMKGFLNG